MASRLRKLTVVFAGRYRAGARWSQGNPPPLGRARLLPSRRWLGYRPRAVGRCSVPAKFALGAWWNTVCIRRLVAVRLRGARDWRKEKPSELCTPKVHLCSKVSQALAVRRLGSQSSRLSLWTCRCFLRATTGFRVLRPKPLFLSQGSICKQYAKSENRGRIFRLDWCVFPKSLWRCGLRSFFAAGFVAAFS